MFERPAELKGGQLNAGQPAPPPPPPPKVTHSQSLKPLSRMLGGSVCGQAAKCAWRLFPRVRAHTHTHPHPPTQTRTNTNTHASEMGWAWPLVRVCGLRLRVPLNVGPVALVGYNQVLKLSPQNMGWSGGGKNLRPPSSCSEAGWRNWSHAGLNRGPYGY